ncbi:hypothetical protein NLX67_21795 [Domibacillus sp. A3M-37]|nr:hypothetical protein [Domibacillus sp. A3M-37]MCP3764949.1 hypothetical protein [Domibacillus sp. A3M-37]
MTEEEREHIFGIYRHGKMFEKLKYPLYVSGAIKKRLQCRQSCKKSE